ncbi:MAG: site-specific integrase [Alphaproteobacteria bacterium]|nr:site-specific integrase [Alphaproteobacteria bacterium]
MPRSPRRPKPIEVHPIRARVVRGPHTDGSGRWYWRAEVPDPGAKPRTVWTGWEHPDRLPDLLAELRATGAHERERARPHGAAGWDAPGTVGRLLQEYIAGRQAHVVPRERGVRRPRGAITPESFEHYRKAAKNLRRHLGTVKTRTLNAEHLEGYKRARDEDVRARLGRGVQASTLAYELKILKLAWKWGRREGWSEAWDLPVTVGTTDASRERVTPTRQEVAAIAEHLHGWNRTLFVLMASTGARAGTIARLRWGHVDLEGRWVELDGKSGPGRSGLRRVPLRAEAVEHLRAIRPEDAHPDRSVLGVALGTARQFSGQGLARAMVAAGIPEDRRFSAHGLRRFAVDHLRRSGVAPEVAACILGHSVVTMLRVYRTVEDSELVEALERAQLGTDPTPNVISLRTHRSSD